MDIPSPTVPVHPAAIVFPYWRFLLFPPRPEGDYASSQMVAFLPVQPI